MKAKKADELGVARASPKFVHALTIVGCLSQSTIDAKVLHLKSFGFLQEEVNTLIRKEPHVLMISEETLGRKIEFLQSFGFSLVEVNTLIKNDPHVLMRSEETLGRKIEFLIKEAGCDKLDVVRNPNLLGLSLEKRLIPRSLVRKLLMFKGLPVANNTLSTFVKPNEKRFVEKFVLPHEHTIPGLHRAYDDACAGNIGPIV